MKFMKWYVVLVAAVMLHGATAIVESRGEARLKLPGGEVLLMDFRTASIEKWKVTKATLALHLKSGTAPKTIRIGTIPDKWTEDDPSTARKRLFEDAKSFAVEEIGDGWFKIAVTPAFVEAMAAEKSHGLAVEQDGFELSGRRPAYHSFQFLVEGEPAP